MGLSSHVLPASSQDTDADEDDYDDDDDDENDDEGKEEEGQHDEYNLVAYAYARGNKKTKWCYNPPGVAFHPGWLCPRLGFQPEENKRK